MGSRINENDAITHSSYTLGRHQHGDGEQQEDGWYISFHTLNHEGLESGIDKRVVGGSHQQGHTKHEQDDGNQKP